MGLECHAGHGLNYSNVKNISDIEQIIELNVGHFLLGQSLFKGLTETIKEFMKLINHPKLK